MIGEVGGDGWVRIRWDTGSVNSYRMGREDRYDLALAPSELEPKTKEGERRDEPEDADISVGEWEKNLRLPTICLSLPYCLTDVDDPSNSLSLCLHSRYDKAAASCRPA